MVAIATPSIRRNLFSCFLVEKLFAIISVWECVCVCVLGLFSFWLLSFMCFMFSLMCCEACACVQNTLHISFCACACVSFACKDEIHLCQRLTSSTTLQISLSLSLSPPRLSVGDEIHNQIKKTGGKGKIDSSNMRWAKEIDKNDPHLGWIHAMMMLNADDMDTVYLFHPFAFDCSQSLSISYIITHTKAPPLR